MEGGWLKCVTDANLWMDLLSGNLESKVFGLPWQFMAPDVILAEVLIPYSWNLQGLGLIEKELPGDGVQKVENLISKYPKNPGRRDLFALVLAKDEGAILLSGDRALRKAAYKEGVEVHGTIWLMDNMVDGGIISPHDASDSLHQMLNDGRRLPQSEVNARIASWNTP